MKYVYSTININLDPPGEGGGYAFNRYNRDYNKKWNRWKECPDPYYYLCQSYV